MNIDIENGLGEFIRNNRCILKADSNWTNESVKKILDILINFLKRDNIQNTYRQYEQGTYFDDIIKSIIK